MPSLVVWMNGQEVGTWTQRSGDTSEFVYKQSWIESRYARALSLAIPITVDRTVKGAAVTNYFDNLLPDNPNIRKRISDKWSIRNDTFELLTAIGRDCVGAVQLLPVGEEPAGWDQVRATPLTEAEIAAHLRQVTRLSGGFGAADDEDDFRISIAGAQEKTALLRMGGKWHRPLGATPTTHILKLPLGVIAGGLDFKHSIQNEWLCSEFLHAMGLSVARTEMLRFEDQDVLSVTRFDRRWIGTNSESVDSPSFSPEPGTYIARLPQEDLCQAFGLPSEKKYENKGGPSADEIVRLLSNSEDEADDKARFILSQLLLWLLAAPDGHAKNFSLQYTAGGGFRLTPLYDVLSAWPLIDRGPRTWQYEKASLAISVRSKNRHYRLKDIQARHWKGEADKTGIAALWERMIEVVERAPETFESLEARLPDGFPSEVFNTMRDGIKMHAENFKRGRPTPPVGHSL